MLVAAQCIGGKGEEVIAHRLSVFSVLLLGWINLNDSVAGGG